MPKLVYLVMFLIPFVEVVLLDNVMIPFPHVLEKRFTAGLCSRLGVHIPIQVGSKRIISPMIHKLCKCSFVLVISVSFILLLHLLIFK